MGHLCLLTQSAQEAFQRQGKGEVIYNPSVGRPNQIGNELNGNGQPSVTNNNFQVQIDAVNTKSDYEDMKSKLSKDLRDAMLSVR